MYVLGWCVYVLVWCVCVLGCCICILGWCVCVLGCCICILGWCVCVLGWCVCMIFYAVKADQDCIDLHFPVRRSEEAVYSLVARSDKLVRCHHIHKTSNDSEGEFIRGEFVWGLYSVYYNLCGPEFVRTSPCFIFILAPV